MNFNPFLNIDGYNIGHWKQLLPGTQHCYGYGAPRKGPSPTVVWGINEVAQKLTVSCTETNIMTFLEAIEGYGPKVNIPGFSRLIKEYAMTNQEFPLLLRGLREGTVVRPGIPHYTLVNTDPKFPWLSGFLSSFILRDIWYASTVASISRDIRQIISTALEVSGTIEDLPYKLVDFGTRGATAEGSAALGGAGHGISFRSSDNVRALSYIKENHFCDNPFSTINASEHATVTQGGPEGELDFFRRFIEENLSPGISAACVSDSYNIWEALKKWKTLEPEIKASGGTLVVRPDSGNPVVTPIKVINNLIDLFGSTDNTKGFKVLPPYIRVIQGDGIDKASLKAIIDLLYLNRLSMDNLSFGMGGGLLQQCDRDTYGWAFKCSASNVDGYWRDVWKDPLEGSKTSLRGLVTDRETHNNLEALMPNPNTPSDFVTYYDGERGYLRSPDTWDTIKERANESSMVSL